MLEELTPLPPAYVVLLLVLAAVIAWRVALFWWKVRQADQDLAFKKELLGQNYAVEDIERLCRIGKTQAPVLMVPFTAARVTPGPAPAQEGAGVPQPETAAPAAGGTLQGGMSFGDWYEQRFAGIPQVFQAMIWLLYGYLWIPLFYLITRPRGSSAVAVQVKTSSVLPAFVGAAFFVAVLFPSISILVHVSSSDSRCPRSQGEMLAPECWVVPVEEGREGSCRIVLSHDHHAQSGHVELSAMVIAQSSPSGKLQVEAKPGRLYFCHGGSSSILVTLHALQGTGDFTVQVTAVDERNQRAATIFTVQVRPPTATESPS